LNLANAKLSYQKQKKFTQFFQKLRVWAAPIKIFRYNKLLCTDSLLSVCVKQNLKKQAVAVVNGNAKKYRQRIALPMKIKYVFFYCSHIVFRLFVQAAKQQAVRLSSDCVSGKYLWALPTPTTFEKVDQTFQTFIITCQNTLLNHNFKLP